MEGKLDNEREEHERRSECGPEAQSARGTQVASAGFAGSSVLFANRIGAVPWTIWDVGIAAAVFVPVGFGGSFGLALALSLTGLVENEALAVVLGSTLLPLALLAGTWVFSAWRHKVPLALLGFRQTSVTSLLWLPAAALAVGLSISAAYALLVQTFGFDTLVPDQDLDEIAALKGVARLSTFAIVGVLAPFAEEVFFRGFMLAALASLLGGMRGAILSSAMFSVLHLNASTLLPIFVMGMLLAWLYLRTGSIWPSVVAHAAQNILALTFMGMPGDAF